MCETHLFLHRSKDKLDQQNVVLFPENREHTSPF